MEEVQRDYEEFSGDELQVNDYKNEEDCATTRLSTEDKQDIHFLWKKALILKVLGKRVGFEFLEKRLHHFQKPKAELSLIDLGNNYYIARFRYEDDYETAFFNGPWLVINHYSAVQQCLLKL